MDYQEKDYEASYQEIFKNENSWTSISDKLNRMQDDPDVDQYRCLFCNELIYAVTSGYTLRLNLWLIFLFLHHYNSTIYGQ